MKTNMTLITTLGLSTLALAGCFGGGDENNGSATSHLSMLVQNNAGLNKPVVAGVSSAAVAPIQFSDNVTTFTITEARMHVRDIRFDTSTSDLVAGETYTVTGPFVMDLLDGSALPSDIAFSAPEGNYQRVDIRVDEANPGDGIVADTDELVGNALIIKGTHNYNSGANAGTFTITVKVTEDIRLEPTNGIIIDSDTGANVVLNYRVTDWLEDSANPGAMIDVTSCIADPQMALIDSNNHITLDEGTQCPGITESIGNLIKDNMKNKYDFSNF